MKLDDETHINRFVYLFSRTAFSDADGIIDSNPNRGPSIFTSEFKCPNVCSNYGL